MIRIVLASDNHQDMDSIRKILKAEPQADYYLHCGDSCLTKDEMRPFISVRGNNDYNGDFEKLRTVKIGDHNILLIHGHHEIYYDSFETLAGIARNHDCDIVFFGHTHRYTDITYDGIRMINPGSTYYNRDLSKPCYAVVTIDGEKITAEKKEIA